jgi:SPX domain protein involved in polyphosphate accumulation
MLTKFHFYRFEFKYLVPEKYKDFIRKDLLNFMRWDSYALLKKQKKYLVNSLYFDSHDLKSYQEKIAGISNRFKLRLRHYGWRPTNDIFFEIKRKKEAVVIKDRGLFRLFLYQYFIKAGNTGKLLKTKTIRNKDVLQDFLFLKTKCQMKPKLRIVYEREPFEGINSTNLRITFDSNLRATRITNFSSEDYYKNLLNHQFILEVKFRGLLPYWFHDLVQKYQLQRITFSKYCQAVEAML